MAALAVICRGYVSMLTRSPHTQAHKRLGDLHRRSEEAKKLLAPTVEYLPQLLIPPVILFVMGLLDTVISSAIPVSDTTAAILFAGLLSATFILAVAIYALWTVYHGLSHPDASPFQSTLLNLCHPYKLLGLSRTARGVSSAREAQTHDDQDQLTPKTSSTVLSQHEIKAFHKIMQLTHEDSIIDESVAAFTGLITAKASGLADSVYLSRYLVEPDEVDSMCYLLSDEASLRANMTVVSFMNLNGVQVRNEHGTCWLEFPFCS